MDFSEKRSRHGTEGTEVQVRFTGKLNEVIVKFSELFFT